MISKNKKISNFKNYNKKSVCFKYIKIHYYRYLYIFKNNFIDNYKLYAFFSFCLIFTPPFYQTLHLFTFQIPITTKFKFKIFLWFFLDIYLIYLYSNYNKIQTQNISWFFLDIYLIHEDMLWAVHGVLTNK